MVPVYKEVGGEVLTVGDVFQDGVFDEVFDVEQVWEHGGVFSMEGAWM